MQTTLFALLFATLAPVQDAAQEEALWIRYPVISPDGTHVAFSYGGDLWVAPVTDGTPAEAELLT